MAQFQTRRIAYALGAEVRGLDLRQELDDATIAAVRQAWLEHQVLVFPGQEISREQLLAFAKRFGELEVVGKGSADPENQNVTLVTENPINGKPWHGYKGGQNWHSDKDFTNHPTTATFLSCRETPEAGGDTMFANTYTGYETLSPVLREIVDQLYAIHDYSLRASKQTAQDEATKKKLLDVQGALAAVSPPILHPVARVHDETKRRALFLGERVSRIAGLTDEESRPLLDFLNRHTVAYEFTYRHRWTVHDLVMWDNRCTLHIALTDYKLGVDRRFMMRCALRGDETGKYYTPEDDARAWVDSREKIPASV